MLRGGGEGSLRTDERGVTVQIGAVLLFGIVVIALATLQVTLVPDQNAGVEFDHSRAVEGQLQDLRNGLLLTAATGDPHHTRVDLGTRYPDRVVFVNPPPASGTLRTVGTGDPRVNVTLEGGHVDAEYENARDYWANASDAGTYDTGGLVYRPDYSEFQRAPTVVYEHSLLANRFDHGETLPVTGQSLVRGNVIDLVALRGSLSETGPDASTVDARPVSETATTVTVRSTDSDPLRLALTSHFTAATWTDEILVGESAVADVRERASWTADGVTYHRIVVEFAPGAYELRTGSVGVGALGADEATPDPAYLVAVDDYQPVGDGANATMTVAVRDRFNNPASDAAVDVAVDADHLRVWNGAAWDDTATLRTGADGKATVRYRAINVTSSGESAWLNASVAGANETWEYRNFTDLSVPVVAVGDGNGAINSGQPNDVRLVDSSKSTGGGGGGGAGDVYSLTFHNGGAEKRTIAYARINVFVVKQQIGGSGEPTYGDLYAVGDESNDTRLYVGGQYTAVDPGIVLASDGTTDAEIALDESVSDGSWFVLSVVFEDGERATYFVTS